jgi:type III secretion protein U
VILITSTPIVIIVAIIGVIANFFVVGPVFSFEAIKFNLKKLNPIEGLKQKFKLKVLVELIKSILKITGAAIIIFFIIWNALPQIITTVAMPPVASLQVVKDFLISATIRVGVYFFLIALFDLFFQRQQFAKEMKMEKFEVRQEYKDTEGDPMIKGKRREMFREIAYQEGPRAARRARAIITNPTHIAIALKYDPAEEPAPIILTMGAGYIAEQIIKIGLENKIPIMRNVELARELFTKGTISHYIPEETYDAVAEILKWIQSLEGHPEINRELLT